MHHDGGWRMADGVGTLALRPPAGDWVRPGAEGGGRGGSGRPPLAAGARNRPSRLPALPAMPRPARRPPASTHPTAERAGCLACAKHYTKLTVNTTTQHTTQSPPSHITAVTRGTFPARFDSLNSSHWHGGGAYRRAWKRKTRVFRKTHFF